MEPARRRRHPLLRAIVFGVAAAYAFVLGVYGAVAIPMTPSFPLDFGVARSRFPVPVIDHHAGLRILCLVAGFAVALVLARAAKLHRFRLERLGLRAF
jgi:hypothetical protein